MFNNLNINTGHQMPNDPMFNEKPLMNYNVPKLISPSYIPPPSNDLAPVQTPTNILFPYEKEIIDNTINNNEIRILPKSNPINKYEQPTQPRRPVRIRHPTQPKQPRQLIPRKNIYQNQTRTHPIQQPIQQQPIQQQPIIPPIQQPISTTTQHKKTSYTKALYTVLSRKNKLPNTIQKYHNAPKKIMKDIYKYSNSFDMTFIK